MLLVSRKDVDVEVLEEGFESSFIGGGSDKKPVTYAKKREHNEFSKMAVAEMYNRLMQIGYERPRPGLSS